MALRISLLVVLGWLVSNSSIAQKTQLDLLTEQKMLIPPLNRESEQFVHIFLEPLTESDTLYKSFIQSLFLPNKYQFVTIKNDADWIIQFESSRAKNPIIQRNPAYTNPGMEIKTASIPKYTASETVFVNYKLRNQAGKLLDSLSREQVVEVTGTSDNSMKLAIRDYEQKIEVAIQSACNQLFESCYIENAKTYFTVQRVFPCYVVKVKGQKKKFADWNTNAQAIQNVFENGKLDATNQNLLASKSYFQSLQKNEFKEMVNPELLRSCVKYQLAMIEFLQGNYADSYQIMAQAYNIYPLMPNGQMQLWFTLNVLKNQEVFH